MADTEPSVLRMGDSRHTQLRRILGVRSQESDPDGDTFYMHLDGDINERFIRERGLIVHRRGEVLTCANVQGIDPHDPTKWTLTPWRSLTSDLKDEYEEGLNISFGFKIQPL